MIKKISLIALSIIAAISTMAQVGINILIPDSSAVLQLESNKKGLGLSRLTTAQMLGIAAPLKGLTVYNTTDSVVEYWNGDCWLKAYEKNCYYCDFVMTISHRSDTLDRTNADSVATTVSLRHIHGGQQINASWQAVLPSGVQIVQQGSNVIDTSGSFNIIVKADIFATGGTIPILVTAYCDNAVRFVTYNVYIKPCVLVDVTTSVSNYDVQAANSTLLPAGVKECVIVTVENGVVINSATTASPALTVGNLNPASIVGIVNYGSILGHGGDGGTFATSTVGGNPGTNGGNALNLTTKSFARNYGQIYAGGGGGGSIGLSYSTSVLGVGFNLGFGVGGGGGSENGIGGSAPSGVSLGYYASGQNATSGVNSIPGNGGAITVPIPITISILTITITPNVLGGNGGAYGQNATGSSLAIGIRACASIPFVGNICPLNTSLPVPAGGAAGLAGLAVKRNNNPLGGLADGIYSSTQVKGRVAP